MAKKLKEYTDLELKDRKNLLQGKLDKANPRAAKFTRVKTNITKKLGRVDAEIARRCNE